MEKEFSFWRDFLGDTKSATEADEFDEERFG